MKVNKMITLDYELLKELKSVNASDLINTLLLEYFQEKKPNMSPVAQELYANLLKDKKTKKAKLKAKKDKSQEMLKEMQAGKITEDEYWAWMDAN